MAITGSDLATAGDYASGAIPEGVPLSIFNRRAADLSQYIARIDSNEDRVLMEEASAAYGSGASRVAYLAIWLSAAEGLKRRFRELASRDDAAGAIVSKFEQKEERKEAIDAFLLRRAGEYGLITAAEQTRLEHVYENRNVFGHPYEQRPSNEAIQAAAADVVEIVLGRPALLRRGYLDEQVRRLVNEPAFLDDLEDPVHEFASEVFSRAAPDLRLTFLQRLWSELEPLIADASADRYVRRGIWFSQAFLRSSLEEGIGEWDAVDDVTRCPGVLSRVLADVNLFGRLSDHAQDIVVGTLLADGGAAVARLELIASLRASGALRGRHVERFDATIADMPFATLVATGLPLRWYPDRVIEELDSHNWYRQNPAAVALRNADAGELQRLDRPVLIGLGRSTLQAAEGTAGDAMALVQESAAEDLAWPAGFIEGLITECFVNERGQVRLKLRVAKDALGSLRWYSDLERQQIVRVVSDQARDGAPKWSDFETELPKANELLREVQAEYPGELGVIDKLVDALGACAEARSP